MRKARPFVLAAGAALALASTSAPALAGEPKIVIVDMRRAMTETEEGLRITAMLRRLQEMREMELFGIQQQIQAAQQSINQKLQSGTPQAKLQPEIDAAEQQFMEFQARKAELPRELQYREMQLLSPVRDRVVAVVKKIAAQDGAEFIIDSAATRYFKAELEVTDRAIQMYNAGQTGTAAPAAPAKPPAAPAPPAKPAAEPKKK